MCESSWGDCAVDGTLKSKNYMRLSWLTIGYSDTRELGLLIWISPFCQPHSELHRRNTRTRRSLVRVCDTGVFLFLVCIPPEVTVQFLGRYNARTNFFCTWSPSFSTFSSRSLHSENDAAEHSSSYALLRLYQYKFRETCLTPKRRPRSQKMGGEENIA